VSSFVRPSGLSGLLCHLDGERVKGALKRRGDSAQCRERSGQSRAEQAVVGSGEEQGDAQAEVSDVVAEALGASLPLCSTVFGKWYWVESSGSQIVA
jgi:hypothetical protein